MSSLTDVEKRYFEKLLDMGGGYVLDFTDITFRELFERHNVDIHGRRYQTLGSSKAKKLRSSKAKKLRAFWMLESDELVGTVLSEMLDSYEATCDIGCSKPDTKLLKKARSIVGRLTGRSAVPHSAAAEDQFLAREFAVSSIQKMPIDEEVVPIVEARLVETRIALKAGAHLSVIFLCGSILEAVLLGARQQDPERFNQANDAPKRSCDWTLARLIDASCEVGILKPDIKKFSHGMRDFRNYIHPKKQMTSGFTPDQHTASLCFQALKAALASVAGER